MKRYLGISALLAAIGVLLTLSQPSGVTANFDAQVAVARTHSSAPPHWPPVTEEDCKPTPPGPVIPHGPLPPVQIQVKGVPGADVSEYEGNIDWPALAKQKKFVIMRFAHGGHIDANFVSFWQSAKQVGVIKGAYVFLNPMDPTPFADQVKTFVNGVKLDKGDLPPILDLESPCLWIGMTPPQRLAYILKWANALEKVYGVKPILYMSRSFTDRVLTGANIAVLKQYPLWLASYREAVPSSIPDPWTSYIIWQYAEDAPIAGIASPADADVAPGSLATLKKYTLKHPAGGDASVLSASDLDDSAWTQPAGQ